MLGEVTLCVLVLVIVVKFVTVRHTNHLKVVQIELKNRVAKMQGDYRQAFEGRQAQEAEVERAGKELSRIEAKRAEVREALEAQEERNAELE